MLYQGAGDKLRAFDANAVAFLEQTIATRMPSVKTLYRPARTTRLVHFFDGAERFKSFPESQLCMHSQRIVILPFFACTTQ